MKKVRAKMNRPAHRALSDLHESIENNDVNETDTGHASVWSLPMLSTLPYL